MTYALHDVNGYIGDIGSASGMEHMHEGLKHYPSIKRFFSRGWSEDLKDMDVTLELASRQVTDPDLQRGIGVLLGLIRQCEEAAFITDE